MPYIKLYQTSYFTYLPGEGGNTIILIFITTFTAYGPDLRWQLYKLMKFVQLFIYCLFVMYG